MEKKAKRDLFSSKWYNLSDKKNQTKAKKKRNLHNVLHYVLCS